MLGVKSIKGSIVGDAVRELDVDGRKSGFHKFQIDQQTARSTVAINERMDSFKGYDQASLVTICRVSAA